MTNDEKKTLLQQRYAELDDESLCALERHKLTEQARELFDAELARRGLDLAALWVSRPSLPVSSLPGPPWSGSSMATVWTPWRPCLWLPAAWPWSSSCWPLPCAAAEAPAPAGQISPRLRSCQAISVLPRREHCLYLRAIACCPSGANIGPLRQLSFLYKKRGNAMRHFPVAVSCRPQKDVDG